MIFSREPWGSRSFRDPKDRALWSRIEAAGREDRVIARAMGRMKRKRLALGATAALGLATAAALFLLGGSTWGADPQIPLPDDLRLALRSPPRSEHAQALAGAILDALPTGAFRDDTVVSAAYARDALRVLSHARTRLAESRSVAIAALDHNDPQTAKVAALVIQQMTPGWASDPALAPKIASALARSPTSGEQR